ncbi:hypothetical protein PR003_g25911 [Phytophthora rubi]|uniref:Uncharacterized protein n=1 Tax=Phytophthora rubi TaxID=129364 RepID=A0A6A4CAI9_9STRA|nr:hypothetical protein PR003_g25911 [Phytophthora rubi]
MPTPTLSLGSLTASSSVSSLERSYSSSSLRASPSKASPGRMPQKSFGRLPVRVAAEPVSPTPPPPIVTRSDDLSSVALSTEDGEIPRGVRQEIACDPPLEADADHEQEKTKLRTEVEALRQELRELRGASSKNDETWQRDNARLKEQLKAASTREAAQEEQLRIREDQLALCRQELRDLQQHQVKLEDEQRSVPVPPAVEDAGSSGLGQERELLKLVVKLVGTSNVRSVLRENPNATPAQLRDALIRLRCPQCRRLSPSSRTNSPPKSTDIGHSESLHELLTGPGLSRYAYCARLRSSASTVCKPAEAPPPLALQRRSRPLPLRLLRAPPHCTSLVSTVLTFLRSRHRSCSLNTATRYPATQEEGAELASEHVVVDLGYEARRLRLNKAFLLRKVLSVLCSIPSSVNIYVGTDQYTDPAASRFPLSLSKPWLGSETMESAAESDGIPPAQGSVNSKTSQHEKDDDSDGKPSQEEEASSSSDSQSSSSSESANESCEFASGTSGGSKRSRKRAFTDCSEELHFVPALKDTTRIGKGLSHIFASTSRTL